MFPDRSTVGAEQDVIEVLLRDHREVEEVFRELEAGTGSPEHRRQLADAVTAELVRHSVAEEEYLYPTVRHVMPGGGALADEEIEEHAEAERLLKRLESTPSTAPEFDGILGELMPAIRSHIAEEESELFPRLREHCTAAELADLGRKVTDAKRIAPTRPHPSAPDTPPLNKALAPGAGLVDRVRDAFSGRTTRMDDVR